MCPVESERDPSGCRASSLTPELPVHVVLVSSVAGSVVVDSAATTSSGAGTDAIFWIALGSFIFARCGGYKKLRILLVPATALSNRRFFVIFFSGTGGIQARTCIRRIHHIEV